MKFKQITDDFPIENKAYFFLDLIVAMVFATILVFIQRRFQFPIIALVSITILGVFMLGRSRRLFSDWTSEKDIVGEIDFEENALTLNKNESILYEDIKNIHFRYNYIKGHNIARHDLIHNGLAALHLTTKNDEAKSIIFVIETKEQFEFLKPMFKKWYQSGITIKEEFTNQKYKTICLKVLGNMSYKDIQALKEEIKPHTP